MAKERLDAMAAMNDPPPWQSVSSSNVGAIRFWPEHPSFHVAILDVWFHTSDMTYSYACPHQTYHAMLRSGSKGKFVHRNLISRGYLDKRAGKS